MPGSEQTKIGGRLCEPIDPETASAGDVLEYVTPDAIAQRRCHRVTGRRKGRNCAVRVRLHPHEGGGARWIPIRNVIKCWRRIGKITPGKVPAAE